MTWFDNAADEKWKSIVVSRGKKRSVMRSRKYIPKYGSQSDKNTFTAVPYNVTY